MGRPLLLLVAGSVGDWQQDSNPYGFDWIATLCDVCYFILRYSLENKRKSDDNQADRSSFLMGYIMLLGSTLEFWAGRRELVVGSLQDQLLTTFLIGLC